MNLGRGDARQFSGGGQNMPPPDFQQNKVGIEELKKLGTKRQASSQNAPSFAPTSMFTANRGSNTRSRNHGPGGALVRQGEESGASSRTGTPPAGRGGGERGGGEGAAHANAFG
jgi:translation initiation factor 4G